MVDSDVEIENPLFFFASVGLLCSSKLYFFRTVKYNYNSLTNQITIFNYCSRPPEKAGAHRAGGLIITTIMM